MAEYDFSIATKTAPNQEEEKYQFGASAKKVETKDLGAYEKAKLDIGISGLQGIGKGITYLMDLPQAVSDAGDFIYDQTLGRINFQEMRLKTQQERTKAQQVRDQMSFRIEPGKAIRESVLTYQPKTTAGRYAETMAEYATPGGLLGKGAKAKTILTGTGLIGGATEEVTKDLTGNDLISTAAGVGTNIALDIFALSRGNPAGIAKRLLPNEELIEKAKRIQKYGKERGINLTTGEATNIPKIFATEASLSTTEKGSKIFDDFYQTRPEQVKIFAKNMADELGFITRGLDTTTVLQKQKKVAALLKDQRTKLWERSGGLKFKETYFDQVQVDNIVAEIEKLKLKHPSIASDLEKYANDIRTSNAKGGDLHAVYREIRDIVGNIAQNPNKTVQLETQQRVLSSIEKQIDNLLSTNDDYLKAQKKYKQFTNAYIEPYNRLQIFKDVKVAGFENDPKVVGKIYRFLNDIQTTPRDIEKLANAYKATGNPKAWQEIVSAYFEDGFMKSIADSSANPNFGKAISDYFFKSPRHRENFTEMVYQMAKQRGSKLPKKDIKNSVDSMFQVLKAASKKPSVGSATAQRGEFFTELEKNKISQAIGGRQGIPLTPIFIEFFNGRTLSKNSQLLSKALTSEKGIDALIDLAQNYKDPAKIAVLFRTLSTALREE